MATTSESKEFILEFIAIYRDHPELWDQTHKDYVNRHAKATGYEDLLKFYRVKYPEATRETLVKKINSLRVNFRKELRKVLQRNESGTVYEPKLYYFNEMKFLFDHMLPSDTISTGSGDADMEFTHDEITIKSQDSQELQEDEAAIPSPVYVMCRPSPRQRHLKKTKQMIRSVTKDDDGNSILARGYTFKLSKMTREQSIYADKLINDVLMEGQLGNLSRSSRLEI